MNGNFTFHNPVKLHFGEKAMDARNRRGDEVIAILRESL